MNKRVIAAISAGVLALLGVLVLVMWAQGANERAFEGAKLISVVRVTEDLSQGASAQQLASSTETVKLPEEAIPDGAVTNLSQVSGLATNASVQKGEVLLKSRMVAPGDRGKGNTDVPKGMQEISLSLDAQHSVGGAAKAGDRVGVVATFDPKDGEPYMANLVLHDVIVTKVSGASNTKDITTQMYTVAVRTADAERLAFAADFGRVWFTLQNTDTDKSGEKLIRIKEFAK